MSSNNAATGEVLSSSFVYVSSYFEDSDNGKDVAVLSGNSLQDECKRTDMLGDVLQDASQFLFPCAIEYSLICAAILYVIWRRVLADANANASNYRNRSVSSSRPARRSRHHYSVDCAKANKGLFAGIFILVATIISLVIFFALISNAKYRMAAILEINVARLCLFLFASVAAILGMFQVNDAILY